MCQGRSIDFSFLVKQFSREKKENVQEALKQAQL